MKCKNCGSPIENADIAAFCGSCGSAIEKDVSARAQNADTNSEDNNLFNVEDSSNQNAANSAQGGLDPFAPQGGMGGASENNNPNWQPLNGGNAGFNPHVNPHMHPNAQHYMHLHQQVPQGPAAPNWLLMLTIILPILSWVLNITSGALFTLDVGAPIGRAILDFVSMAIAGTAIGLIILIMKKYPTQKRGCFLALAIVALLAALGNGITELATM